MLHFRNCRTTAWLACGGKSGKKGRGTEHQQPDYIKKFRMIIVDSSGVEIGEDGEHQLKGFKREMYSRIISFPTDST
jgi:hypothetical protein